MIARLLIAGAAIGALAFAGAATAKVSHHSHHATAHGMTGTAYTYAGPGASHAPTPEHGPLPPRLARRAQVDGDGGNQQ